LGVCGVGRRRQRRRDQRESEKQATGHTRTLSANLLDRKCDGRDAHGS
jgi:hypothetical protein